MSEVDRIHNRVMPTFQNNYDVMLNKKEMRYVLRLAKVSEDISFLNSKLRDGYIDEIEFSERVVEILEGVNFKQEDVR